MISKQPNIKFRMKKIFLFIFLILIFNSSFCNTKKACVIPIKGVIDLGLSKFVERSISEAEKENADFIVFVIDTFGGRLDAALEICSYIEKTKKTTIAFIENRAWSAGALIALACQNIFMSPSSSIGSAEPRMIGIASSGEIKDEKIISALRAQFKSLAYKNNYPVNLALAMVDKDFEIKQVKIKDEIKILTTQEIEDLKSSKNSSDFVILKTINPKGKLLNLTALESKEFNLAKDIIKDIDELFKYFGIEKSIFLNLNWSENLARFITNTFISSLLLILGLLCLFLEFKTPGFGIAGVFGFLFLGLFFFGHYLAGLANLIEIIIFILGIILLLLEIFVIPGFGITGVFGVIFIILGIFLGLFKYPTYFLKQEILRAFYILFYSISFFILGVLLILRFFPKISILKGLILKNSEKKEEGFVSLDSLEEYLNKTGITITVLRPSGKVDFSGKILDAIAQRGFIDKGKKVKVIDIKDSNLVVEEI